MSFQSRYGRLERLLHRVAFATGGAQVALADIEDRLFAARIDAIDCERPLFVTALPRAGTTILLNILVATGHFASHLYRDMPFVLCPLIWHQYSRLFRIDMPEQERAHGDGLTISIDSPEAFEEIIWRHFWRRQYRPDRIEPWARCDDGEFVEFLVSHMRKVVALRRAAGAAPTRYLSKNNLNIARLPGLAAALPDSIIVVPFREPVQHAASLLNQHLRFLDIHRDDPFARRYMADIGHFEFGDNLRPVDFGGWVDGDDCGPATALEFWLAYWIATYRHVLDRSADRAHLLSYRGLYEQPHASLRELGRIAAIDGAALAAQAGQLKAPRDHQIDTGSVDARRLQTARALYEELESRAIPGVA